MILYVLYLVSRQSAFLLYTEIPKDALMSTESVKRDYFLFNGKNSTYLLKKRYENGHAGTYRRRYIIHEYYEWLLVGVHFVNRFHFIFYTYLPTYRAEIQRYTYYNRNKYFYFKPFGSWQLIALKSVTAEWRVTFLLTTLCLLFKTF